MKDCLAFLADVKDFLNSQNLKSSSPQRSSEDMHIIYDVFAGSVIREGFGKLSGKLMYLLGQSNRV